MALLDWMKGSAPARSKSDDQGSGWQRLGVYLYRADGRYPSATWAETPQQFGKMIAKIREHVDSKLEVRITNTDDHLLFHATHKGIEWDGIRLSPILEQDRKRETFQDGGRVEEGAPPSRTHSIFSDFPDRVLKTENDVKKDDALLEMTLVVNEIANDPDTNWRRYKGDFEKAVNDMRQAFEAKSPIRGEPEPENDPDHRYFTKMGNPITPLTAGEWRSDGTGLYEYREHVGRSIEGYHGGLEISRQGGDGPPTKWTNARPTEEEAKNASYGISQSLSEPEVIWTSDVYRNGNADSWAWVQMTGSGRFDSGITVFAHGVGCEEWETAEGHETKNAAMAVANESFERWRKASAPDMKVAPSHLQQEIKGMYGLNEKENKAPARERDHGWPDR